MVGDFALGCSATGRCGGVVELVAYEEGAVAVGGGEEAGEGEVVEFGCEAGTASLTFGSRVRWLRWVFAIV